MWRESSSAHLRNVFPLPRILYTSRRLCLCNYPEQNKGWSKYLKEVVDMETNHECQACFIIKLGI